jgi:hypothetical protein
LVKTMNFWESYGPILAKQAELIASLTNKNNELTAKVEWLNDEIQKKKEILLAAQESCAKEHAGIVEQNTVLLAQNQLLAAQAERAKDWENTRLQMASEIEDLKCQISTATRHLEESKVVADQRQITFLKERNLLVKLRDELIQQNKWLTEQLENAATECEEEYQPVGPRATGTEARCQVPDCGASMAKSRPNNYPNPEYGERICLGCHSKREKAARRERYLREKEQSKPKKTKPHPQGGLCLVEGCGAKRSPMWRKNNTDNPDYGELICNSCWHKWRGN